MLCHVAFLCLQWHSIREQRGTHKKGKEWRLVIHGPAKRWRMPSFSSVLLHIWCCYKTYTIKGLLLCPWCVVTGKPASPETQLYYYTTRTTTGHHATNHFFREKSRKKLGQIAFLLGQYAQKGGTRQFQKGEAIILLFSCFLLTVVVLLPGHSIM